MKRFAPSVFATLILATPALAQHKAQVAAGQKLAQENCAPCHSIGKTGVSRRKGAPPFRTLSKRYDIDELQEAFAEGIAVGHKGVDMPEFTFTPDRIDALIVYLKSIQN